MVVVLRTVEKALKKLIKAIEKSSYETPEGHKYIILFEELVKVKYIILFEELVKEKGAVSDLYCAINPIGKAELHRTRGLGVINKCLLDSFSEDALRLRNVLQDDERFVVSGQHVGLARHGREALIRHSNLESSLSCMERAFLKLRKAIQDSELETKSGCKYLLVFTAIFEPNSPIAQFYREVRNALNVTEIFKDIPEDLSGVVFAAHVDFLRDLLGHVPCPDQANADGLLHISGQVVGLAEDAEELDQAPAALLTRSIESARSCVQRILEHQNRPRCMTFNHPVFRAAALLNVEIHAMSKSITKQLDFGAGQTEVQKRILYLLVAEKNLPRGGNSEFKFKGGGVDVFSTSKAMKVGYLLEDDSRDGLSKVYDLVMTKNQIAYLREDEDEMESLCSFVRDISINELNMFFNKNRMPVRPSSFNGYSRLQRKKFENGYKFISYLEACSAESDCSSYQGTLRVFESAVEMLDKVHLLPSTSAELISATPEHTPNDLPVSACSVPDPSTKRHYLRCASEHLSDSRPRLKAALDALSKYQEMSDESDVTAADDSFAHVCHVLALAYGGFGASKECDTLIEQCFGILGRLDDKQANSLRILLLYCRCVVRCKQHRYTEMNTVQEELDAVLEQGLNEWDHFAVEALSIAANLVGLEMTEDHADTMRAMLGELQVVEPDAVCLASHCENKDIYYDCGYFGHILLLCCAGCKLTYHFPCLKQLRSGITKEKEFNGLHHTACLTDGCEGTIVYGCIYKSDDNSAMSSESKIVEKKYFGSKDAENRKRKKSEAREAKRGTGGESAASASCNSTTEQSRRSSTEQQPDVVEEVIVPKLPVTEEDIPGCSSSLPNQPLKLTEQFGLESFKRIETKKKLSEQEAEPRGGKKSKKNKNKKKQIAIDLKPISTDVSTSDFTKPVECSVPPRVPQVVPVVSHKARSKLDSRPYDAASLRVTLSHSESGSSASNDQDFIPPIFIPPSRTVVQVNSNIIKKAATEEEIRAVQIEMACDDVLTALGAADEQRHLSFVDDAAFFQRLRERYPEFRKEIDHLDYPSVLESDKRLTVVGVQPCVLVGLASDSARLILVAASAWRQHMDSLNRKMMDSFISTMRETRDLQQFSNDDYESLVYALRDELRILHKIPESNPVDSRVILSFFCKLDADFFGLPMCS